MQQMNRRRFLAATAGVMAVPALARRAPAAEPARLKLGLIGCGGYGRADTRAAFKAGGVEMIALCDVDSQHLTNLAAEVEKQQGSRPKTFKHYEELLATPGLNAVVIATPPQWHALPFLAAAEKNLDIYCEKPLAYDVREGQAMLTAAQKKDIVVQIGFQRRQSPAIRQVRDYLQQGHLGRIVQAEAQIHYSAGLRDTTPQEPPASLDWDLWCGPAPKLPYSPQIGHVSWRLEKTTGHGHLVDWGIHLIDATRWILGETTPHTVQASGGIYYFRDKITTPDTLTAQFDFATCPVLWKHRIWGAQEYTPEVRNGIFFYGEKGTVFVTDDRWVVVPKDKNKDRQEHKAAADMGTAHMAEFLSAVRSRKQPGCTVEDGYRSTTTVKLAMIAYDLGQKIAWDEKSQTIVDNPQADTLLKRPYRTPWKHPYEA
ncbi:MAG: Gfo/Idh/MocA family oxidoreductase [Planctomycetes bacterium]|nr:Gfo/Idh/MocA family oxidoreductase [Planctomycetota bacterium]